MNKSSLLILLYAVCVADEGAWQTGQIAKGIMLVAATFKMISN